MHRRREIETGGGLKLPAPQQRDRGDQRDRRDEVNCRETDPLRCLSPDDAANGQARELHGCKHRHAAPPDPGRQRKLGRYVQGGDRGDPGNSGEHARDQGGCRAHERWRIGRAQVLSRPLPPPRPDRHLAVPLAGNANAPQTAPRADCAEQYAVCLRAAGDSCAHEQRQKRPIDAREREEASRIGSGSRADPGCSERSAIHCEWR